MYWYEAMALNKEIYPNGVTNMKIRGESGKMTAPDDYTIVMEFIAPYGVVIERLCRVGSNGKGLKCPECGSRNSRKCGRVSKIVLETLIREGVLGEPKWSKKSVNQ